MDEVRRRLWAGRVTASPEHAMERAFVMAHDAANDAAREVLESMPLDAVVTMERDHWAYWRRVLGEYSLTLPTGTRIGKRWVFDGHGVKKIGEYTNEYFDGRHWRVRITWRRVEFVEQ